MIKGIGTGYSHSGSLANITLLGFEIKNMKIFINKINLYDHNCVIQFWKRYIDDERLIVDIRADGWTKKDVQNYLEYIIDSLESIYPENIKLESKYGKEAIGYSHKDR